MTDNIAEAVDGFGEMNARQLSVYEWIVTSWRNGEKTAHGVDLHNRKCTCEDFRFNKEDSEVCDHILKAAYVATQNMSVGEALNHRLLERINAIENAVDTIERRAAGVAADTTATDTGGSQGDASDSEGNGSGEVVQVVQNPSEHNQQVLYDLRSWFNEAAGFNGFDGSIIDLEVARIADHSDHLAGEQVIKVERQPFSGGYYDDGEWQDKDAFDEHKEAAGDSILSPRDEFHWFGEPDYSYVIPIDAVPEVTE